MSDKLDSSLSYRILVAVVPLFIVLYIGVVMLLPRIGYPGEQYLLYSWFVFHEVPARTSISYDAYVLERGGEMTQAEKLEWSSAFLHDEIRNIPDYRRRIRSLGESIERGDVANVQRERSELEAFALEKPLTYEIVLVQYNPIAKFLRGEVVATTSLAVYTTDDL